MAGKKVALLVLANEKWSVSFHDNEERAEHYAQTQFKDLTNGWTASSLQELRENESPMSVELIASFHDFLTGTEGAHFDTTDAGTEAIWKLLVARMENKPSAKKAAKAVEGSAATPPEKSATELPAAETQKKGVQEQSMAAKKKISPKPKAKAKAKAKSAAPKRKASANGAALHMFAGKSLSDGWRKALAELGKKDGPIPVADFKKIAEKHGVKPWFRRYVNGGIVALPKRGLVELTKKGRDFLKEAAK